MFFILLATDFRVIYNDELPYSENRSKSKVEISKRDGNEILENVHNKNHENIEIKDSNIVICDNNENRIRILEMQLKALESLFSLQERIIAENGLTASMEGMTRQRQQKIIYNEKKDKEEEKEKEKEKVKKRDEKGDNDEEEKEKTKRNEGRENNDRKKKSDFFDNNINSHFNGNQTKTVQSGKNERTENTNFADRTVFKELNIDSFPYLRLLELWRKKCFNCTVERMRSEKVIRNNRKSI